MILPGLRINDSSAIVAKSLGVPFRSYDDVPCDSKIIIDSAHIKHEGVNNNYKPYLHVLGSVVALKVRVEDEVYTFTFDKKKMMVNYFYKFSQSELLTLVEKGYFSNDFRKPDIEGLELNLNLDCSLVFLEHEFENKVPIVFIEINNKDHIDIDRSCGYTLVDSFYKQREERFIEKEKSNELNYDDVSYQPDSISVEELSEDYSKPNSVESLDVSELETLDDFEVNDEKETESISIAKYKEELIGEEIEDKWSIDPFKEAEMSADASMQSQEDLKNIYNDAFKDTEFMDPATDSYKNVSVPPSIDSVVSDINSNQDDKVKNDIDKAVSNVDSDINKMIEESVSPDELEDLDDGLYL